MTRRWLITGGGGMLATDLCDELDAREEDFVLLTQSDLDITNAGAVMSAVRDVKPSILVNCAAYTQVDDAESNEALANAVNGSAVEFLAGAANFVDALLMHISTDFVFDGAKRAPYEVNDLPSPLSAYGRSKLIGEFAASHAQKSLIVRTSWLFGVHGPNFVEAIRNQILKGKTPLQVVNDQRGRPTYTPHLANALIRLCAIAADNAGARGVVHYADANECTWFDFATAIVEEFGAQTEIMPVTTAQFVRPAPRPACSVLSTERYERLTGARPESWRDGLREYLALRP